MNIILDLLEIVMTRLMENDFYAVDKFVGHSEMNLHVLFRPIDSSTSLFIFLNIQFNPYSLMI
jgi:hypothetical protein